MFQLTIKDSIPEDQLNEEAKYEIEGIKEKEKMVDSEDLTFGEKKMCPIFNNLKQKDLLPKIFLLIKLF